VPSYRLYLRQAPPPPRRRRRRQAHWRVASNWPPSPCPLHQKTRHDEAVPEALKGLRARLAAGDRRRAPRAGTSEEDSRRAMARGNPRYCVRLPMARGVEWWLGLRHVAAVPSTPADSPSKPPAAAWPTGVWPPTGLRRRARCRARLGLFLSREALRTMTQAAVVSFHFLLTKENSTAAKRASRFTVIQAQQHAAQMKSARLFLHSLPLLALVAGTKCPSQGGVDPAIVVEVSPCAVNHSGAGAGAGGSCVTDVSLLGDPMIYDRRWIAAPETESRNEALKGLRARLAAGDRRRAPRAGTSEEDSRRAMARGNPRYCARLPTARGAEWWLGLRGGTRLGRRGGRGRQHEGGSC
jgi:hypothetical protein